MAPLDPGRGLAEGYRVLAGDIDATNVLPAYLASIEVGVSQAELDRATGWTRQALQRDGATVSGESTYRHMAWMFEGDDYLEFLRRAVDKHGAKSLGVVGLACKTTADVGRAMALHARHQHLTNRTAHYAVTIEASRLRITEHRRGDGRAGERLLSDFTLLVAHRLLASISSSPPRVICATGRFDGGTAYESTFGSQLDAPFVGGKQTAELVLDASILHAPTVGADRELSEYFEHALGAADQQEPTIVSGVRSAIRAALIAGEPSAQTVAQQLALGQRTMQRRLAQSATTFRAVLDDERRTLAAQYLARPELSLGEVAFLLGFAERASFFKAFRRWYDTTPAAYRRRR